MGGLGLLQDEHEGLPARITVIQKNEILQMNLDADKAHLWLVTRKVHRSVGKFDLPGPGREDVAAAFRALLQGVARFAALPFREITGT